jgi:hypothetical protein
MFLTLSALIFITNTPKLCNSVQNKNVTIVDVNKSKIEGFFYIMFKDLREKEGIIISKKEEENCEEVLKKGKTYSISLDLINTTEGLTDVTHRLYQNDIYIDGKLVFPRNIKVYTSESLEGLCLTIR